ncbi:MAG: PEGA domain-containing protein, partial [Deltaproteobacteria bacterium]|nr:PEGA domain-containing protein [Deltaproteobacteria bacterium]
MLRALARSPDHRYGSALEMGSALQSFLFTIGSQYNKARLGGFLRELFGREDGAPPPTRSAGSMSRGELQPSPSSLLRVAEEQQAQTWENDHPPVRSGKAAVQPAVPGGQVTEGAGGWGRSPTRRSPAPAAKSGPLPLGRLSFSSPGRAAPAAVPVPSPWPSPRPEQREGRPGGELSPEPKSAPGGYMAAANQREGTRQQQGQGRTATGPPAGPARSPLDDLADGWPAPPPLPPVGEPGWGWDMAPTLLPTIEDPPQVAPPAAPHSPAEDVDEDDETTVYLGAEKPRSIPAAPVADDPTHDEALLLMSEAPTVEHAEGVPAFHAGLLVDEATQRPRQAAPVHGEMHEDRPWPALVVAEERGGWQQPFAGLGNRPLQAGGTPSSRQVLTFLAALAGILTSGWLISFCSHSVLLRPGLAFDFQRNEVVTRPVETAGAVTGWPAGRAPTAAPAPAEQPAFLPSAQPGAAAPTARPEVGAARPEIGATRLEIVSRPLGAQVEVNGKPLPGVTPLTVVLEPGRYHDLGIELAHHQPWSSRLVLETGEQRLLSIKLEPILGQLEVHSRPAGAEVLIDDLPVGVTPLQLQELPISDN